MILFFLDPRLEYIQYFGNSIESHETIPLLIMSPWAMFQCSSAYCCLLTPPIICVDGFRFQLNPFSRSFGGVGCTVRQRDRKRGSFDESRINFIGEWAWTKPEYNFGGYENTSTYIKRAYQMGIIPAWASADLNFVKYVFIDIIILPVIPKVLIVIQFNEVLFRRNARAIKLIVY